MLHRKTFKGEEPGSSVHDTQSSQSTVLKKFVQMKNAQFVMQIKAFTFNQNRFNCPTKQTCLFCSQMKAGNIVGIFTDATF